MLPPIDQEMRIANPKFDALYNDLCSNKLNPDGSTKIDAKAQRERDSLSEDLRKARIETARRDIVKSGLLELSYRPDSLPEALQELVAIVAAVLQGQIPEDDRSLLQDDLTKFKNNTKPISAALSVLLEQDTDVLASLLDPEAPPASKDLATRIEELQATVATARSKTTESRLKLTQEATRLHELYRQIIETSIRILEQTIHGSVARGTKAKADYLATVAEGMNKKLAVQHGQFMSQLYSPEIQEALQVKRAELDAEIKLSKRKVHEAEQQLEEYRTTGGMESLAKEYAELVSETVKVKAEVDRLKGGGDVEASR